MFVSLSLSLSLPLASPHPFCCSSTFKDAERASLRDSGHGDSDQADSDQDTNKGSHCDTSAREALKMKATAVNGQPFEQGERTHTLPDILKMPNSRTTYLYFMRYKHARSSPVFKWSSSSLGLSRKQLCLEKDVFRLDAGSF